MSELSHQGAFRLIYQRHLSEAERRALLGHLRSCAECRQDARMAGFFGHHLMLKELPARPSPQFTAAYLASAARRSRRSHIMKPVYAIVGVAALALIVLAGWFIARATPETTTLEPAPVETVEVIAPTAVPTKTAVSPTEESQVDMAVGSLDEQLIEAVANKDAVLVNQLLNAGANPNTLDNEGSALLPLAAYYSQLEIVRHLLDAGADINGTHSANNADEGTALLWAAVRNDIDVAKLLIANGADLDRPETRYNRSPLFGAAWYNNVEVVKILLESGADPNFQSNNGQTPLHYALINSSQEVVQALVEGGADLDSQSDGGTTPLMMVRNRQILTILLKDGANPDVQDSSGDTALHRAALANNDDFVSILIEYGADVGIENLEGQTALDLATDDKVIETLREAGASESAGEQTAETLGVGNEERIEVMNVPSPSLSGALFGKDDNRAFVYLPPSYHDANKSYPTLYILPSGGSNEDVWEVGKQLGSYVDRLVSDGKSAEMIIVMPDYTNSSGALSFFADSPVNGDWQTFVAHDLVAYIDANYRTLPDPVSRGLLGEIFSGASALNLAMIHPDIFGVLYLRHPWLFAPGGLAESRHASAMAQMQVTALIRDLRQMSKAEAHEKFLPMLNAEAPYDLTWDAELAVDYGLAFAGDPLLNAPYFEYLYTDDEVPAADDVWARWEDGYGNIAEKVAANQDKLKQLRAIAISVGEGERADLWAQDGINLLSSELTAAGITHEMQSHEGDPVLFLEPFAELIVPFFSEHLVFEE